MTIDLYINEANDYAQDIGDGRGGMAAAFDGRPMDRKPVRLTFKSVEEQDGIVWIRYQVNNK